MTGVVRDRTATSVLKVSSVTSNTNADASPVRGRAVGGLGGPGRLLPALRGGLPRAEVNGTVDGEVPRLLHNFYPAPCSLRSCTSASATSAPGSFPRDTPAVAAAECSMSCATRRLMPQKGDRRRGKPLNPNLGYSGDPVHHAHIEPAAAADRHQGTAPARERLRRPRGAGVHGRHHQPRPPGGADDPGAPAGQPARALDRGRRRRAGRRRGQRARRRPVPGVARRAARARGPARASGCARRAWTRARHGRDLPRLLGAREARAHRARVGGARRWLAERAGPGAGVERPAPRRGAAGHLARRARRAAPRRSGSSGGSAGSRSATTCSTTRRPCRPASSAPPAAIHLASALAIRRDLCRSSPTTSRCSRPRGRRRPPGRQPLLTHGQTRRARKTVS